MARGSHFNYRPGGFSERLFGGDPVATLRRELNRVFDDLDLPRAFSEAGTVDVDVRETADAVKVCADLPGVAEADIDVSLEGETLTIRGERKAERREARETVHVAERSATTFTRSVRLPVSVDADAVTAEFRNGVLTVTLPKPQGPGRARKIPLGGSAETAAAVAAASSDAFIQGDGAVGPSPSTGAGAAPEPSTDEDNAAKPGGAVHGYNE